MKKLFTLIALMMVFMSANAITIVDAEVDFSTVTELPRFGWGGSESAFARISLQDGCLHFSSTEATDPTWDCQWFPIGGVDAEVGVTYTLHYKVKGDHSENISALGFGQTPYGQFPITDQWVEGTFDYECTSADGNILMQAGGYVGTFDIAYLRITHEGKQERPVEWIELLTNGNAEQSWESLGLDPKTKASDDNNYKICFWTKEKGTYDDNEVKAGVSGDAHPAEIITEPDGNHAFICRATTADTEGDASAWDNQIWIESPRAWKTGEQFRLMFRYKASEPVVTNTQVHKQAPGDYLFWQAIGDVSFTTEWQQFEQVVTVPADANGMWSVAFNLNPNVKTPVDFYIDDISWCEMKLEHGLFAAAANTETGLVEYDFDNAVTFAWDDDVAAMAATVGTVGNKDSWVNELMVSTVLGNDRQFKANTLKTKGAVLASNLQDLIDGGGNWVDYEEGSSAKIKLPAQGVWTIYLDQDANIMAFVELEGDKPLDPIVVTPNTTEIVVKGKERNMTMDEAKAAGLLADPDNPTEEEKALYNGQTYDNQFFIVANRALKTGEVTVLEFDYYASAEAKTTTQIHGEPGAYKHWQAIGDVNFTPELQHFSTTFTVPAEGNDMKSIAFNMAEIKEACDYNITNVIWKLEDNTETLIDMTGAKNFCVKEGAGTAIHVFGEGGGLKGDADEDGEITVSDITAVAAYILGAEGAKINVANADVDDDGEITVSDITAIAAIILGVN